MSDALGRNVANFRDQLRQQQLLAHESAANDAMNKHRAASLEAVREYKSSRNQSAVDGYPDFKQALIASHAEALQGLSPQARTLVKPHLDQALNHGSEL